MNSARATAPRGGAAGCAGPQPDFAGRLSGDLDALDDFARELGGRGTDGCADDEQDIGASPRLLPRRINANPGSADKDLAKLVLSLVDMVRQLMERQAVRRINAGSLTEDQVERMGETFLKLDQKMSELRTAFGLKREDLNVSLGPIRDLL